VRIVLDFQACQSASRFRGIGRASRSLMLAMGSQFLTRGHEVICLLSEAFQAELDPLRKDIEAELPRAHLAIFRIPSPCAAALPENQWRQMAARLLREHAIACLEPDFVHIPTLLADGWVDDAVASVGLLGIYVPVSLTQHDLIPLVMADSYMPPSPFRDYYMTKLEDVKNADLLLAISEYSQREAIEWLEVTPERVTLISSAADLTFWRPTGNSQAYEKTLVELDLRKDFFLYAPGGFDYRKNLDRLFKAYALLPAEVRVAHQLVIASRLESGQRELMEGAFQQYGLKSGDVVLTDYVSDDALKHLYSTCFAYVFPSLHEGFGLPVLEAMACGAAVIASNCTSIPEVLGMEDALFDPLDPHSMAARLSQLHTDSGYRARLLAHAKIRPGYFSWERSGQIAVDAILSRHHHLMVEGWRAVPRDALPSCEYLLGYMQELVPNIQPTQEDLTSFSSCYEFNLRQE
jgi:glycosyltransferase involved in cell wall biosynthesis